MITLHAEEVALLSRLLPRLKVTSVPLTPRYFKIKPKAVLFDIYGTLISSAAGDVGTDTESGHLEAFQDALNDGGWLSGKNLVVEEDLIHKGIIEQKQHMISQGVRFPEINIKEVWQQALQKLNLFKEDSLALRLSIFSYECRTNPVWPMPNLDNALRALKEFGLHPGILSNAQFYTPLLMEYFLKKTLAEQGFDNELTVWSYEEGVGKPGEQFYDIMQAKLTNKKISPHDVVYVGNDMIKDIAPANSQGWVSVLFAGDTRSLKMHETNPEVKGVEPDMVITDLAQLSQILA